MFKEFNNFSTGQKLAVIGIVLLLYGFSFVSDRIFRDTSSNTQNVPVQRRKP